MTRWICSPARPAGWPFPSHRSSAWGNARADLLAQPQAARDLAGGLAVGGEALDHLLEPAGHEATDHRAAAQRRFAGRDVPDEEAQHRHAGPVDLVGGRADLRVVVEPVRHLVRVGDAPDPRQERHVVRRGDVLVGQAGEPRQPCRDHGLAEDMLLRLAEAEVGRQGQRGNQLSEPHAGHLACHRREAYCGVAPAVGRSAAKRGCASASQDGVAKRVVHCTAVPQDRRHAPEATSRCPIPPFATRVRPPIAAFLRPVRGKTSRSSPAWSPSPWPSA